MKKVTVVFLFLLLFICVAFSKDSIPSQIKEVTLFSNQALIKREAQVSVDSGLVEILLETNAFNIDSDSVSAKVFGDGEIYSVQLREAYLIEAPQEKIKDLEEKIQALKDQKTGLKNQVIVLNKKSKFINSVVDFAQSQIPKEIKTEFPDPNDLEQTLSFLDTNLENINKTNEGLTIKIREVNKEIEVLKKELASLKGRSQKSKRIIEILFNSKRKQQIKAEASYIAYSAYWQPFYKVDVPLDLSEANLTMFSKLVQKTGENWQDILLNVSNVIPLRGVGLPQLNSWQLDIMKLKARRQNALFAKKARSPALDYEINAKGVVAMGEEFEPQEAGFAQAVAKELPLSFEYQLPQKLTIESQDKETILPLFSKTLSGDFFHYAIPKMNPVTFLVCKATSDKELLSGYLNVYFGGRFIGKTYLSEKKAGEDFHLNLGGDREVKVKREKIKDKIKETFFGKIERQTVIRELEYKISIENLKGKSIKIKVFDNIPVSKTDKIVVKDVRISPKPKEENYQDREGVNLWEFNISPKEKQEITLGFTITYPKDQPIHGL